jgi:hypothetical protein
MSFFNISGSIGLTGVTDVTGSGFRHLADVPRRLRISPVPHNLSASSGTGNCVPQRAAHRIDLRPALSPPLPYRSTEGVQWQANCQNVSAYATGNGKRYVHGTPTRMNQGVSAVGNLRQAHLQNKAKIGPICEPCALIHTWFALSPTPHRLHLVCNKAERTW